MNSKQRRTAKRKAKAEKWLQNHRAANRRDAETKAARKRS